MTDIFVDKKSIHFKLDRNVHFALRAKLFKHNVTMQELFDEVARLVASDTARGQTIIESIVNKRLKRFYRLTLALCSQRKKNLSTTWIVMLYII